MRDGNDTVVLLCVWHSKEKRTESQLNHSVSNNYSCRRRFVGDLNVLFRR